MHNIHALYVCIIIIILYNASVHFTHTCTHTRTHTHTHTHAHTDTHTHTHTHNSLVHTQPDSQTNYNDLSDEHDRPQCGS